MLLKMLDGTCFSEINNLACRVYLYFFVRLYVYLTIEHGSIHVAILFSISRSSSLSDDLLTGATVEVVRLLSNKSQNRQIIGALRSFVKIIRSCPWIMFSQQHLLNPLFAEGNRD